MGLTQITTGGIKDLTITTADIAADAITNAKIANNAVTVDNLPTGTVNESILNISNTGSNGQFLQKQSGNTGGLTWADASVGGATGTDYNDNVKVRFGTGNDLQIWHDATGGNYSYIFNHGAALLKIGSDEDIVLGKTSNETFIHAKADGAVELYYDNSKKFETVSDGVKTYGHTYTNDANKTYWGNGNDLWISHDGSNSRIKNTVGTLYILGDRSGFLNAAETEWGVLYNANAAVELYYNGSKKIETTNTGISVSGKVEVSDDLDLTGASYNARWDKSANALELDNNAKIVLGTGGEVELYHNGSNTYFKAVSADAGLMSIEGRGNVELFAWDKVLLRVNAGESGVVVNNNGSVELYYDNAKKFETTSAGAYVTGRFEVNGAYSYLSNDSNSYASLTLKKSHSQADGIDYLQARDSGNNLKMKISSAGNIHFGGVGGLRSDSAIVIEDDGGNEWRAKFHDNDKCEFAFDNSKKLETTNIGITVTGSVTPTSGLYIGGTGGGNWLDDYEEGTFTPSVYGASSSGSWSTNNHKGTYVKVGSLVFVGIQVSGNVGSAGSGALTIGSLPFTSASTANATGGHGQALAMGALYNWNVADNAYQIGCRVQDNASIVQFWNNIDNANDQQLTWPFGSSGTKFGSIAGCYRAA
jgi:hypothetical protein